VVKKLKTTGKQISAEKEAGRFYTPAYMVEVILDLSEYYGERILDKHAIDNSCGDGAFLCQIVSRYCNAFFSVNNDKQLLKENLEKYIHGIETEPSEHRKCIENLSSVAESFDIHDVQWDVLCADALYVDQFDSKMDYVLGNPPYVRVHHLGDTFDEIKKFSFSQSGMSDLYIVFFEIGIRMLNQNGILGYITPSSYFNSIAGGYMREFFVKNNLLQKIADMKHYQAFSATTYTAITVLQSNRNRQDIEYYRFNDEKRIPYYVDTLTANDFYISGDFYFAPKEDLQTLKQIYFNLGKSDIYVKNGYATLCDPVFIHHFPFASSFVIPVVKASKGIMQSIFFPYDENGSLVSEEDLQTEPLLYQYLIEHKETLLKRSIEKGKEAYWYAFGRSQAIGDTFCDKIAINSLIRTKEDWKFTFAPSGTGVYGGLYIISDSIPFEDVISVLKTDEFERYVSLLGKYKSGGYYTYSSKDIKRFLDYKFAYNGGPVC